MKLIKITTATKEGSRIWSNDIMSQYVIERSRYENILITQHTFLNCQNFTLGNSQLLLKFKDAEIKEFLTKIKSIITKRIMILDLKGLENVKAIQAKLKHYSTKFYRRKYISTNGSEMYICHVYLNQDTY